LFCPAQVTLHPCELDKSERTATRPLHACGASSGILCRTLGREDALHAALNDQGLRRMLGPEGDELAARALAAVQFRPGDEWLPLKDNDISEDHDDEVETEARDAGYGFASGEDDEALQPHGYGGGGGHFLHGGLGDEGNRVFNFGSERAPGYAIDEDGLLLEDSSDSEDSF
jgi:hypothetical protein